MRALRERGLEGSVYLWSDDNLSNDYFWQHLDGEEIDLIRSFRGYGRVGCFKGFDRESFGFNTAADQDLFDRQFDLFGRLIGLGLDVYAYVTLTAPTGNGLADRVARFVDQPAGRCATAAAPGRSVGGAGVHARAVPPLAGPS